jgi:bifunctional DNase/RNase
MIEMDVVGVALEPNSNRPLVWLKDREQKLFLPIAIGNFEATAIYMELYDEPPPRPITHDLLRSILEGLDVEVGRIVINALRNDTFYAEIQLSIDSHSLEVDSRPSDAIALALRSGAPIFVSEQVVREAGLDVVSAAQAQADGRRVPKVIEQAVAEGGSVAILDTEAVPVEALEQRVVALKTRLREAVEGEQYEEAAELRDELAKLGHEGT